MKSEKRIFGDFGEDIASKFLMKHGFLVLERNYLRKWGEIDIVARRGAKIHFVEVKTVKSTRIVSHETQEVWRAEENIHPWKLKRLSRAIQTYLLEKNSEDEWQFDAIVVEVDSELKKTKVRYLSNIVL